MRLTPHFTLAELTITQHRDLDNDPPPDALANLQATAAGMERVRSLLGDKVISVCSGYRSPAVNKRVGGQKTSQHMTGQAVDFNCFSHGAPLAVCEAIARSGIEYDQLIHEFGRWVHISFPAEDENGVRAPGRRQNLTIDKLGTRPGLLPVR